MATTRKPRRAVSPTWGAMPTRRRGGGPPAQASGPTHAGGQPRGRPAIDPRNIPVTGWGGEKPPWLKNAKKGLEELHKQARAGRPTPDPMPRRPRPGDPDYPNDTGPFPGYSPVGTPRGSKPATPTKTHVQIPLKGGSRRGLLALQKKQHALGPQPTHAGGQPPRRPRPGDPDYPNDTGPFPGYSPVGTPGRPVRGGKAADARRRAAAQIQQDAIKAKKAADERRRAAKKKK